MITIYISNTESWNKISHILEDAGFHWMEGENLTEWKPKCSSFSLILKKCKKISYDPTNIKTGYFACMKYFPFEIENINFI